MGIKQGGRYTDLLLVLSFAYSSTNRISIAAHWARVAVPCGTMVVSVTPVIMPCSTAQAIAGEHAKAVAARWFPGVAPEHGRKLIACYRVVCIFDVDLSCAVSIQLMRSIHSQSTVRQAKSYPSYGFTVAVMIEPV